MAHRPVLLQHRAKRIHSLAGTAKKNHHWDDSTIGERGQKKVWLPTGAQERIIAQTAKTASLAPTNVARPAVIPVPPNAVGVMLILGINANTNTSGQVQFFVFRARDGAAKEDAAGIITQEMGNNSWQGRSVQECPLVDSGVWWATVAIGTVNYDVTADLIGWVLE